jgi:hypothetical protein
MSIENAAFTSSDKVLTAINNKPKAKGIFCDTEKAFGCVNHDILHKMEICGISGLSKNPYTQYTKIYRVIIKYTSQNILISNWSRMQIVYHTALFWDLYCS